jgi:hypothetical protein
MVSMTISGTLSKQTDCIFSAGHNQVPDNVVSGGIWEKRWVLKYLTICDHVSQCLTSSSSLSYHSTTLQVVAAVAWTL